MIDLYTWTTPNGRKISVALEEMGLPYAVHTVNIRENEQFKPDFLAISPNNKIPAIVDRDTGTSVFESGAILVYLAEKSGRFLAPAGTRERARALEWLMWQVGGFGPMLGQFAHFALYREDKVPAAIERFASEARRLCTVLDTQLGKTDFVAGDYTVADMAIYPWSAAALGGIEQATGASFPNILAWHARVASRPAVARGMAIP